VKEETKEKKKVEIKKPKKKVKLIIEESSEEEIEEEEDEEEKPVIFEMEYNGKKYKYISVSNVYSGITYRDWKLNGFSQMGKILDELDDYATKVLGLKIYVPEKDTGSGFIFV
jgi:hypothetical protein